MDTKVAARTEVGAKEVKQTATKAGAKPFTGIEALWDKVDGFGASLIVAGSMAGIVLIVGVIMRLLGIGR